MCGAITTFLHTSSWCGASLSTEHRCVSYGILVRINMWILFSCKKSDALCSSTTVKKKKKKKLPRQLHGHSNNSLLSCGCSKIQYKGAAITRGFKIFLTNKNRIGKYYLRPLEHWNCRFESCSGHGCVSAFLCVVLSCVGEALELD
jgi:hypothetical protein